MFIRFKHCLNSVGPMIRIKATPLPRARLSRSIFGKEDIPSLNAFYDLLQSKTGHTTIEELMKLLAVADNQRFIQQKGDMRVPLNQIYRRVMDAKTSKLTPTQLVTIIDHASNLNILSQSDVTEMYNHVSTHFDDPDSLTMSDKCMLALWTASLWHGYPTERFHRKALRMMGKKEVHIGTLARLAWCVYQDPGTKIDPSVKARVDGLVEHYLRELDLREMIKLAQTKSNEYSVIRRLALTHISRRVSTTAELRVDNRIPSQLLTAWMLERALPENTEFVNEVVRRSVMNGVNVDAVFEAVAVLNLPVEPSKLFRSIKRDRRLSVDQITSLCLSFATLKLFDLEATAFLAGHLSEILIHHNVDYHLTSTSSLDFWKIGAWYAYVLRSASPSTVAALEDGYRDLCTRIASGMWDNQGRFVHRVERAKLPPNERAVRSIVAQSLASLGISTLSQVHIVNTPYTAPLFIPDKDMVLLLVSEDRILPSGELVGNESLKKSVIEGKGYQVRIMKVPEVEMKHVSESQDEFLAYLLREVQVDASNSTSELA